MPTNETIVRGAFMHPALSEQFTEAAWVKRTTKSQLLFDELGALVTDPDAYAHEEVPASGPVKFHANFDPELWAAVERAAADWSVPLGHVVRVAIARAIKRSGLTVPSTLKPLNHKTV